MEGRQIVENFLNRPEILLRFDRQDREDARYLDFYAYPLSYQGDRAKKVIHILSTMN